MYAFTDKLSRLLPYQPVYSKEMTEKIELEEEKIRSVNSFDVCPSREYSISSQVCLITKYIYNMVRERSSII